jgi:hypothetical protein
MKILLLIGIIVLLGILGLVWLYRAGTTTTEKIIGEVTDGKDRLMLKSIHTTSWGNSYNARTLLLNGKLVDFRGSLMHHEGEGRKIFPLDARSLRVDILDASNADDLRQVELLRKQVAYLVGHTPYELLVQRNPSLAEGDPWTLWVSPKDFSEAEYQRIIALLRTHGQQLREAQSRFEQDTTLNPHRWLRYPPLLIWRMVYHDYGSLKNVVFERKTNDSEEKITVAPHGTADFHHKSERYQSGFGCTLGQLSESADTLFLSNTWPHADVPVPMEAFAEFKDAQGRRLSEVYRIAPPPPADTAQ